MAAAAGRAGVPVAAGDTKVVERGKADGLYVTTAGVGVLDHDLQLVPASVRPGDRVLLSGTLADHGMAVMIARGDLHLEGDVESDTAPLHELTAALLGLGEALRWMRDPTRGGLATALNELARRPRSPSARGERAARADRRSTPPARSSASTRSTWPTRASSSPSSRRAPPPRRSPILRAHPLGADAVEIGVIEPEPEGMVLLDTSLGGSRIVDMLVGDPLATDLLSTGAEQQVLT